MEEKNPKNHSVKREVSWMVSSTPGTSDNESAVETREPRGGGN